MGMPIILEQFANQIETKELAGDLLLVALGVHFRLPPPLARHLPQIRQPKVSIIIKSPTVVFGGGRVGARWGWELPAFGMKRSCKIQKRWRWESGNWLRTNKD